MLLSILGYSQTTEFKLTTLTEAFNQEVAGNRKDYCTTKNIKVEIIFSGNVQRVVPDRATRLNKLINDCGLKKTQDWSGGTTEMLVIENGKEFWLQVDNPADNQLLSKFKKGEALTIYCQLICEHSFENVTTFIIVKKIEKE